MRRLQVEKGLLSHLVSRFFTVLFARPLGPRDQAEAEGLLRPEERRLFWSQPVADQRHGLDGARFVLAAQPGRRDLARAALLHDIGKRHAGLGVLGRVLAAVLQWAGAAPGRLATYRDHGPFGAEELDACGAEFLVVDFARHHHGARPDSIDAADWSLLQKADTA